MSKEKSGSKTRKALKRLAFQPVSKSVGNAILRGTNRYHLGKPRNHNGFWVFSSLNFQVGKIDTSPSPRGVRPDLNLITERFGQILIKYNKGPVDGTIERSGGLNDLL